MRFTKHNRGQLLPMSKFYFHVINLNYNYNSLIVERFLNYLINK